VEDAIALMSGTCRYRGLKPGMYFLPS